MYKLLFPLLLLMCISCSKHRNKSKDLPVAKVYEQYLYKSQIRDVIPATINAEDSVALVKDYIDKWIRTQLLLYQAEEHLSAENKNVERQIEDYRTSLLIYKYEQNYIKQKLDTNVSNEEMKEYYKKNSSNFILNKHLIKGRFIKLQKTAPKITQCRKWYKSDKTEDLKELESYCFSYATRYDYFDEKWEYFSNIQDNMPPMYSNAENILRNNKYYETLDSTYYYFLKISDFKLAGSAAPLEYVFHDIRNIILNKRKMQLIKKLEAGIYNDALNRDNFTKY